VFVDRSGQTPTPKGWQQYPVSYAGGALRRSAPPGRGRPEVEHIEARRQRLATFSALAAIVRYAKLAPGAVSDEATAVLDALAVERPITGRAA
jgi:hypothetical protein